METGIDGGQALEAAHEQAGAGDQEHGHRRLQHHQRPARAAAGRRARSGPRAVAQRFGEIRPGHLESRRETGQHAGQ